MERVSIKNTSPGGESVLVNGQTLKPGDEMVVHLSPEYAVRVTGGTPLPPADDPPQTAAVPNAPANADPDPPAVPVDGDAPADDDQEDETDG